MGEPAEMSAKDRAITLEFAKAIVETVVSDDGTPLDCVNEWRDEGRTPPGTLVLWLAQEVVRLTAENERMRATFVALRSDADAITGSTIAVESFDCIDTPGRCMGCRRQPGDLHRYDCDRIVDAGNRELRGR